MLPSAEAYTVGMRKLQLVFLALASFAFGQNTQIGGMIGAGGIAQLFETSAHHVVAGVESCVLCGGRLGLFMEYQHWSKTSSGTDQPLSLDLASGGLRIQGKGTRVRPFFDVGVLAGAEKKNSLFFGGSQESRGVGGGVLGFGAAISITEHWYMRPMAKIVVLSTQEFGGFAGASVGYRF
jgi:hypothetical protein